MRELGPIRNALAEAVGPLRAIFVAFTAATTLILGFPGLDGVGADWLSDPGARARALASPGGALLLVAAEFNRDLRVPLDHWLAPLQRPLRLAQSWELYGSGPNRVRRGEIRVDGVLKYRTGDAAYPWLSPLLRYRRVRPVMVSTCRDESANAENLVSLIASRARRDFPGARTVELRCTSAAWPGDGEAKETVRWTASAPDWTPTR